VPDAHALLVKLSGLAIDILAKDTHQAIDLMGRARPVLA
jgi:hypothetical protein